MAIIEQMWRTEGGLVCVMTTNPVGDVDVVVGTDDEIEDMARDLLDFVGRDYCLPHVCDHLDVEDRRS